MILTLKLSDTIKRDTLFQIIMVSLFFNPPYVTRNKSKSKVLYDKYNTNDLYKCFIISLINSGCIGGIMIIPNFICSIRKADIDLRRSFLKSSK